MLQYSTGTGFEAEVLESQHLDNLDLNPTGVRRGDRVETMSSESYSNIVLNKKHIVQ